MSFDQRTSTVETETAEIIEDFPLVKLQFPDDIFTDMAHLESLALAELTKPEVDRKSFDASKPIIRAVVHQHYKLLPWGKRFVEACCSEVEAEQD